VGRPSTDRELIIRMLLVGVVALSRKLIAGIESVKRSRQLA